MEQIEPPKYNEDYPDRFLDCQEAMEQRAKALLADTIASGWGWEETHCALVELADNLMLSALENRRTEKAIKAAGGG